MSDKQLWIFPEYQHDYTIARVKRSNKTALELFRRHYSCKNMSGKVVGGRCEMLVYLVACGDDRALFVMEVKRFAKHQWPGCLEIAVFRNETRVRSSLLIKHVMALAKQARPEWPKRAITFVNGDMVASINPGYCFKRAGFVKVGITGSKLMVFLRDFDDTSSRERSRVR